MVKTRQLPGYLVSFSERTPGYLFPFFLLTLEWVLRSAFQLNTQEFIGPTLAATGVGMVISLTSYRSCKMVPENTPANIKKYILENKLRVETKLSIFFKNLCWTLTFILILLWIWSIILSTQSPNDILWLFPKQYYPGIASFFIGFVLSEIKEVV